MRVKHGRMNYSIKTPNPICRLFFKIDLLTDFAASDFIDWRHSLVVGISDPACELLPPWTKELYLRTVAPLPSLLPPPPPSSQTKWTVMHCKKSWRSSSTPASGDAGPKHTGVEQSFRHLWRKFYYKYRISPTFFTSIELVRQSWKVSKACSMRGANLRHTGLQSATLPLRHTFLTIICTITLGVAHTYKKMPASCASSVEMLTYTNVGVFLS